MDKLIVELTDRCNLKCGHCPSGRHGGHGLLALELMGRVAAEAGAQGIDHVSFTGGEATLHPAFAELIASTCGAGLDYSFVTNGWSLPKVIDRVLPHRERLRMITFSLDGAREATHDALRGAGSYRRVLRAVSLCVYHALPFTFNMVLTRHNVAEAPALVELAAGLGALGVRFGHLMPDPHPFASGPELGPAERRTVDAQLQALRARSDFPVGLAPGGWSEDLFPCAPLRAEEFNLDWQGRLGLCCQLSGFGAQDQALAADLNQVTLAEGLEELRALRDAFKREKQARRASAEWQDDDHFACWHCAKRFDPLQWLRQAPNHPWHAVLTKT